VTSASTALEPLCLPLKTDYRLGDSFEPAGLRVRASYGGAKVAEIGADQYELKIGSEKAEGYELSRPGSTTVTIVSRETPSITASFEIRVSSASLKGISIAEKPVIDFRGRGEGFTVSGDF
jgi:Bacterial Ig-like domain (group 3).